jgi:thiosulfate dehydrogenase [quinone] large subunit
MAALQYVAAALRLSLGWVFLWAFLDKTFGLGHETAHADAWIRGGSPTKAFLQFAAVGPFKGFYHSIAGAAWADWLFMMGLAGIGAALILGVTMRIAAAACAVMLVMMSSVVLPPANNVFMDGHLIYALLLEATTLFRLGAAEPSTVRGAGWSRTFASTQLTLSGPAITGLRSSSATSGMSCMRRAMHWTIRSTLSWSTGAAPRYPVSSGHIRSDRRALAASTSVTGGSRKDRSAAISVSTPPAPTMTSGPKVGSR